MLNRFLQAISVLTTVPVRPKWHDAQPFGPTLIAYPVVGLLIGAVLAALAWYLRAFFPPLLAAALLVAVWVGITGALHLDGWGDCCDAFFAAVSPERRLAIMKDPHLGSFGTVGLIVLLLVKVAAVAAVLDHSVPTLPLLAAPLLGRWMAVLMLASQPLAKPDGMAAISQRGLEPVHVFLASLLPLVLLVAAGAMGGGGRNVLVYVAVALLVMLAMGRWARVRINGITGDVCGATIEATETAVLVACSAFVV